MSIKKLFSSTDKILNAEDYESQKEIYESVESQRNAEQINIKQNTFVPRIDYSNPNTFARFGSAYLYYSGALNKISEFYPYDGSDAEKNEFYNNLLEIEKYIFNQSYPRSTGYITISDTWGSLNGSITADGYGLPSSLEYITLKGGPTTGTIGTSLVDQSPNPKSNKFNYGNIYDTNIYETAGLSNDFGKGSRLSNLRANFEAGVTVEFWLKTGSLDPSARTKKQVIFDWWNNEDTSSADYGRILIELTTSKGSAATASWCRPFLLTVQSGAHTTTRPINLGSPTLEASLDSWKHYAITMFNTASALQTELYVDGTLSDSDIRGPYDLTAPFRRIDSPLVMSYTSDENLKGWWRLNSDLTEGGTVADNSGNGHTGSFAASSDYPDAWSESVYPSAYIATGSNTFDGTDTKIRIGSEWDKVFGIQGSRKITYALWARPTALNCRLIQFGNNNRIDISAGGKVEVTTTWDSSTVTWATPSSTVSVNNWYHIVVTYDAGSGTAAGGPELNNAIIYVDGVSKSITESGTTPTGDWDGFGTAEAYIAGQGPKEFAGQLVDVSVWDKVLTSDEVQALYSAKLLSTESVSVGQLQSKGAMARIGALQTSPPGSSAATGAGKLSGSLDEFRYWKVKRSAQQIGRYWFDQVAGGANTDISNTTLGVYYKFNEGVSTSASVDQIVLDYAGRITNGFWTGYGSNSRNTGSAIVLASASAGEYEDPIVRTTHPDFVTLKDLLLDSGSFHDTNNNTQFVNYMPSWIIEDHENTNNDNLKIISHIMGAYFDKMHVLAGQLPSLRHAGYVSGGYEPIPFASHLPQSLGLYTPPLFIDATIMENLLSRDDKKIFHSNLQQTKNLIYTNLYNNLTNIFKSKGTEKAIRNVLRCFHLDESIIKLKKYSANQVYALKNNLQQQIVNKKFLNFNDIAQTGAVIYQAKSDSNPIESSGFISGSSGSADGTGYEDGLGFSAEMDVTFPKFYRLQDKFNRFWLTSSLFGVYTVNTGSQENLDGTSTTWIINQKEATAAGTQLIPQDPANFQVYAIRPEEYSKNVYFKLSSSHAPNPIPFTTGITSSIFADVYDNDRWNISVRVRPSNWPVGTMVSMSADPTYDLIFRGVNTEIGAVHDSFEIITKISSSIGKDFLRAPKRLYAGAHRTNITGAILQHTDVLMAGVRYWSKFIDNYSLDQHIFDSENVGISGSYKNIRPLSPYADKYDMLNLETLALDWRFDNVTGANASGDIYVEDFSSGSYHTGSGNSWLKKVTGPQHSAIGSYFSASNDAAATKKQVNSFKFIDPEQVIGSDMIQILSEDDSAYGTTGSAPNYVFTIEKSMYDSISSEMLMFFAGVVDFNNVIGAPVNRYRQEYKELGYLRDIFFRKVAKTSHVEKYLEYYKWFDEALVEIISQLMPASADYVGEVLNVVESHVLERNKYQTKFPTLEATAIDPDSYVRGITELDYPYGQGFSPPPESPRDTKKNCFYWKQRAERDAEEITSGDATIDSQRETFKNVIFSTPNLSQSLPVVSVLAGGERYQAGKYATRNFAKLYKLDISDPTDTQRVYKGGVNFEPGKKIGYAYTALLPAGPINTDDNVFIPENVLVAFTEDLVGEVDCKDPPKIPSRKIKRNVKVQHGRDWEDGVGYKNVDSSIAFPFNIISASLTGGYQTQITDRVMSGIVITNLHNDVYGNDMEVPMQGPFTDYAVGGHQSRHVPTNTGDDAWDNRPEAWKLLLGECLGYTGYQIRGGSKAFGMVAPDYPWPEANERDVAPYPLTASQKAWLYRDFIAKRPVNIKNIGTTTGSRSAWRPGGTLGNYNNNYDVVQAPGAYSNPRSFIEDQPTLPSVVTSQKNVSGTNIVRNILALEHPGAMAKNYGHIDWGLDYGTTMNSGSSSNQTVIVSRFGAPGGRETMARGFQDFRSSEYSVYNVLGYRNLTVVRPSQGPTGTISATEGIRVFDVLGKDFGFRAHLARHTAKFGCDSMFATGADRPGTPRSLELPNFHKVHRNTRRILKKTGGTESLDGNLIASTGINTSSLHDNDFITRPIPASDMQYSWITASVVSFNDTYGYWPADFLMKRYLTGSVLDFSEPVVFVSASDFGSTRKAWGNPAANANNNFVPTSFARINFNVYDPILSSSYDNTLGYTDASGIAPGSAPLYANPSAVTQYANRNNIAARAGAFCPTDGKASAYMFNALMLHRNGPYQFANWKQLRHSAHPVVKYMKRNNKISLIGSGADARNVANGPSVTAYDFPAVSMRGRPGIISFSSARGAKRRARAASLNGVDFTIKATYNNEKIFYNTNELNDRLGAPVENIQTSFEQTVDIARSSTYNINWLLYTQNIFPSMRNDFVESRQKRDGFNNKFWRDSQTDRETLGATFANSFGITVSQSAWPPDAPTDFLTRNGAPIVGEALTGSHIHSMGSSTDLRASSSAGELQNTYGSYFLGSFFYANDVGVAGSDPSDLRKIQAAVPGALFARKQMLSAPKSVVSPYGNDIPTTGSAIDFRSISTHTIKLFAGEAEWQVGPQAGILEYPATKDGPRFTPHPSAPWWDSYDDFNFDLKLVAKDYAVVPSFRISEHVEDMIEGGLSPTGKHDWFGIAGTTINSSTGSGNSSFYIDYSNSEFLRDVVKLTNDTLLGPSEIMLVCSAAIRFNPLKGFYPADRTLQLVEQFRKSYRQCFSATGAAMPEAGVSGDNLFNNYGGAVRPIAQALWAPGVLYNSIKSGIAVDYPVLTSPNAKSVSFYGKDTAALTNNYMISRNANNTGYEGISSNTFWDKRVQFEALIEPETYLDGLAVVDCEPHPSASINVTCSFNAGNSSRAYSMAAKNFFGAVADFYLEDSQFSRLESAQMPLTFNRTFDSGSCYMMRLVMSRPYSGSRTYGKESGSNGNNTLYAFNGARGLGRGNATKRVTGACPLPQDPWLLPRTQFREAFTMYSRPTAFGPPVSGRSNQTNDNTDFSIPDSVNGFNWSFTPPYYNGEAWVDFIFYPSASKSYTYQDIMAEVQTKYWRHDSFYATNAGGTSTPLVKASTTNGFSNIPYSAQGINANAMQLDACLNLFGMETVDLEQKDAFGNVDFTRNTTSHQKWVIQTKWETPMFDFSDTSMASGNLSTAANYGDRKLQNPSFGPESVPRGIWHQFGTIPQNGSVKLTIDDIPQNWLEYQPQCGAVDSVYNNSSKTTFSASNVQSLVDLLGFNKGISETELGKLKESLTIREAVVAVPYIIETIDIADKTQEKLTRVYQSEQKKFISIPIERYEAALGFNQGTPISDSLDAAGESIRRQVQKMERYKLPPQFDFINIPSIDPVVMYMFEFEYTFDQDDLAYMWQNVAPRDYRKFTLTAESVAHELLDTELLSADNLLDNEQLRWMVFKVKQKSHSDYYDKVVDKAGVTRTRALATPQELQKDPTTGKNIERRFVEDHSYEIAYNWPYDYLSFVELIKMDAQVLYNGSSTGVLARTPNPGALGVNSESTNSTPTQRKATQSSLDKFRSKRSSGADPLRKATRSRSSSGRSKIKRSRVTRKGASSRGTRGTTRKGRGGSGRGGGGY